MERAQADLGRKQSLHGPAGGQQRLLCEANTNGIPCVRSAAEIRPQSEIHEYALDLQVARKEFLKKGTRRLCDEYIAPNCFGNCAAVCSKGYACPFLHVDIFLPEDPRRCNTWLVLEPQIVAILYKVEQRTKAVQCNIANGTFIPTPQQAQMLAQDMKERERIGRVLTTTYVGVSIDSQCHYSKVALELKATAMAILDRWRTL